LRAAQSDTASISRVIHEPTRPASPAASRQLQLENIDNIRDLGGLRTGDGRVTRFGRCFAPAPCTM